jgi:hypothetical protein
MKKFFFSIIVSLALSISAMANAPAKVDAVLPETTLDVVNTDAVNTLDAVPEISAEFYADQDEEEVVCLEVYSIYEEIYIEIGEDYIYIEYYVEESYYIMCFY